MRAIAILFLLLLILGCQSNKSSPAQAWQEQVHAYLNTYQQRDDFHQFMAFYAQDAVLEDMVYGHRAEGKLAIRDFFAWPNNPVKVINEQPLFSVTSLHFDNTSSTALVRGRFNAFLYDGHRLGPWRFLMVLKFNEQGKIRYQQDWINYTPKSQYMTGDNLNVQ